MVTTLAVALVLMREQEWLHQAQLEAPASLLPLGIGSSVAACDGGVIVAGAGRDRDTGADAGAIAVWRCHEKGIATEAVVAHPRGSLSSAIGSALAIDSRGVTICAGAPSDAGAGEWPDNFHVGSVIVIESMDRSWRVTDQLQSSLPCAGAHFGAALAIDSDRLAVGSPDHGLSGIASGVAEVFVRSRGEWRLEGRLMQPESHAGMRFGWSLAIEGNTCAVGSPGFRVMGTMTGRVDLFRREASGWVHAQVLHSPGAVPGASFGTSVAIRSGRIAVGAPGTADGAGAVHIFEVAGSDHGAQWRLVDSIQPGERACMLDAPGPYAFGCSVALSGGMLAVGASETSDPAAADSTHPGGEGSGAVFLFHRGSGENWKCQQQLRSPAALADGHDGWCVALTGGRSPMLVAGRLGNPDLPAGPGCASLYRAAAGSVPGTLISSSGPE